MRHVLKRTRSGPAGTRAWAGSLAGLMAGLVVGAAGLTGCTGLTALTEGKSGASDDTIRIVPEDGARAVGRSDRIEVKVPDGRLERVRVMEVEDARPTELPGHISADGRSWRPERGSEIALAAKYLVEAVAVDADGHRSARHTTFTTAVPTHRFIGYVTPENRSTVGTGMIVSIDFNRPIADRAAVERAVAVTSDPPVEVVGHWFGRARLDFRPREYWRPGTRVTVDLRLRDVPGAPGMYGSQRRTVGFTVGRSQVSRVDAERHTMEVRRGGAPPATVPITAGARKTPTYNGKMVVTELYDVTRMDGRTVGFGGEYDIKDVPHAIRLTSSGTFLHGNYWASEDTFGSENTSHGCIGLHDVKGGRGKTPAGWFFDRTLVGDVVEVVNSKDRKVAPDNGLGGWNMEWKKWRAGSALL